MLKRGYKFRLYPTNKQKLAIDGQLAEACRLYNAALQERREAYRVAHKSLNYYDQASQLKEIRLNGDSHIANYSSSQDVLRRVDKSFQAFFRRLKKGGKAGFPRFKSCERYNNLTFPSYGDGCKLLRNGKLRLQGIGELKIKQHRQMPEGAKIKTVALLRDGNHYYACFTCEILPSPNLPSTGKEVGIDVGLTTYATLSDGEKIENPRILKKSLARLKELQQALSTCTKRNAKRASLKRRIRALHRKVANQRNDFQHKKTLALVQRYDIIAVEKLNIAGMLSSSKFKLNKHISDAAWASFFSKLSYKASSAGRKYVEVNAKDSSQKCLCGKKVPKTLADRWHTCTTCGLSEPRDLVSSKIILRRGLRLLGSTPNEALDL